MAKKQEHILTMYIESVSFKVEKKISQRKGVAVLNVARNYDGDLQHFVVNLPISNLWMDTLNQNSVRCYMVARKESLQHQVFLRDMVACGEGKTGNTNMILTADMNGLVRYGIKPPEIFVSTDKTSYEQKQFYESKDDLARAMLKSVQSVRQVGGLDMVNFSGISDNFFASFGFEQVQDLMGRGPVMWMGSIKKAIPTAYGDEQSRIVDAFLTALSHELQSA